MGIYLAALFAIVGIALLMLALRTVKIVPQSTVILVERLGRFHKLAPSGLHLFIPFIDSPRAVY